MLRLCVDGALASGGLPVNTLTGPVVASRGTRTWIVVPVTEVGVAVACAFPKATVEPEQKPLPVIVTAVPGCSACGVCRGPNDTPLVTEVTWLGPIASVPLTLLWVA